MKRFTETAKWGDEWFQDLSIKHKVFWFYITDNCDHAGVWKVNMRLASFQIGEPLDLAEILAVFKGRIEDIGGGKLWVVRFCEFQYGTLSPDCKPHKKVIATLMGYNLFDRVCKGYPKGIHTLEEKDIYKEEDNERGKGERAPQQPKPAETPPKEPEPAKPPQFKPPTIAEVKTWAKENELPEIEAELFWQFYESKGWMVGKSKMKSWHGAAGGWKARWKKESGGQSLLGQPNLASRMSDDEILREATA